MNCKLISPTETLFEGQADMVVAHNADGEFAVMDDHEPLLAALVPSRLRIKTGASELIFTTAGGLLHVSRTQITIFAQDVTTLTNNDQQENTVQ